MLTDREFDAWADRLRLSGEARSFVQGIRTSPPRRLVQGRGGNVTVRYPSRKMGWTIQGESVRGEWAAMLDLEYDPDVLEYYDQAATLRVQHESQSGALGRAVRHVPDFFVLRRASAGFEECKPRAKLAAHSPYRYRQDADGTWHCPGAERAVRPYGLYYRIRCADDVNWLASRNLVFLEDYLRHERLEVPEEAAATILALAANHPAIMLADFLALVSERGYTADHVYALLVRHELCVDLRTYALAEPDQAPVFPSDLLAQAYASGARMHPGTAARPPGLAKVPDALVTWDGRPYCLLNVGETQVTLRDETGRLAALPHETFDALVREGRMAGVPPAADAPAQAECWQAFLSASPKEQAEALRRYELIKPYLAGQRPARAVTPARTIRYWGRLWRLALERTGCGLVGLLPHLHARGSHAPKLPVATTTLMDEFIDRKYETCTQRTMRAVYGDLLQACAQRTRQDARFITPSYEAFRLRVKAHAGPQQTRKRQGAKAAYQQEPFYWELSLTTPRHGDRPWEIVHIDHTELDLELVYEESGGPAGKCWLSSATDAYSRRFLVVYVSYDPPSYRSCMMVLRLLVQRWARLPQIVVVDGGPEFGSVYFETFLARYEITKKTRPRAHPRHGSVCERLFGTTASQFIHNLRGNTQITKLVRQVTKRVDPKRHACWTLSTLYAYLCVYAYEVYDTLEHPALGRSPREAYSSGMLHGGERLPRLIPYDEEFRMLTLPSTPKGTALLHPSRGVRINNVYYWHEAFRDPRLAGQQVPVRYDPFDIGVAYVYVRQQWVRCHSEYQAVLAGRSEREVRLATQRLRERQRSYGQSRALTAGKLAQFLVSVEAREVVLHQRLRDLEARRIYAGSGDAGGGHRDPVNPATGDAALPAPEGDEGPRVARPPMDNQRPLTAAAQAALDRRRLKAYRSFL